MEIVAEKKFKQTEVGLIPEDWEIGSLRREVVSLNAGVSVNSVNDIIDFDHDYAILKTSAVLNGVFNPRECKKIAISDLRRARLNPRKDHIIISRMNTPDLVGECGYVNSNHPNLFIPDRLWLIELKKDNKLNTKWLSYILSYSPYRQKIRDIGSGTSGSMKNISKDKFLDILIPYPDKNEQTAIAAALSDADSLMSSLEKLIAKKRDIKQGAMQKLLEPKDGWEEKDFGDIADRIVGGGTPSRSKPDFWGGKIPWATVKDFVTFNPHGTQEYITAEGLKHSSSNLIPRGVIIIGTRISLGKAVIYEVDVSINQDLKAIFLKKNIHTKLIYYWFQYNSKKIEELGSGSTVMGLSLADLRRIRIVLPALKSEQIRIATILSDMDAEIDALEVKLEKYRNIKQGMMQNLLTGRTRLV